MSKSFVLHGHGGARQIEVYLRDVEETDLPILFEHQRDPVANQMAAFISRERDAFMTHWAKILADETVIKKAIIADAELAGYVVSFDCTGQRLLGYWLGREYWGKGIASTAVAQFLQCESIRPLQARVAKHNVGSIRVLEKCGFEAASEDKFTTLAGEELKEFVMVLEPAKSNVSS